jgi:hypothetical protein
MSNGSGGGGGNKRNRGGNQQRRRRSGGGGGGGGSRPQAPTGPAMTALGESTYEAVFDHGGSGYGVWFDGVVRDDPMYKQFWKGTGTRPLFVRIEEDRIVLLKQLDRELPPLESDGGGSDVPEDDGTDVDAAIEEAVAEAMAAAEAAAGEGEDRTYTPEEAAALFAAGEADGDAAPEAAAEEAEEPVAEEKPKRKRATTTRKTTKKTED